MRSIGLFRPLLTLLALAALPLLVGAAGDQPPTGLEVGKTAPEIVGKDVNGKPMKLADYRGKVVVIDFFGDW